jgi:hypothetical protein
MPDLYDQWLGTIGRDTARELLPTREEVEKYVHDGPRMFSMTEEECFTPMSESDVVSELCQILSVD